ncbi:MAG TPA: trypsin-like peptidase domain-containing protein [Thermoanaerobaculia bacterium]|jgi:WD40 repeat protein|nr:trypsin-like peptidase domain-containing protein [Thermoanaerobaculia bacterium]
MEDAVRRAIARIDIVDGTQVLSRGTGFLVGPGLVLTALHVVANRHQDPPQFLPGRIVLTFPGGSREARLHPSFWDRRADWALLTCDPLEGVRPLPMADLQSSGDTWETYGFPDANPRDGMVQRGTVENHLGDLEGVPAFQLFSHQAAAGHGAPVKGLSGGPVLVDGALVGLLRFALMKDGQAVAGTLYACPVAAPLARTGDLFPVPDPCHGLPGLKRRPLPAKPFRYLDRFTASDAEIFFGRNREIRELYLRVTDPASSPIVLLYGQSGVGKSSFLDAGLLPRLEWYHEVRYVRRDAQHGLGGTLRAALQPAAAEGVKLVEAWRLTESQAGRPLIVILDQVEEAYTRPAANHVEMAEFFSHLEHLFGDPAGRPQGRLVLGFRKEWFPEVQKQLEVHGLDYAKVFLEGLDRAAILEVATGLTRTPRLRERYGLEVEPGLAEVIAGDLLADRDSPIAPTLQILLTRMWQEATAESQSAPRFTHALYGRLRDEGYLLGDFLDQQLQKLGRGAISPADSERLGEFLDRQLEKLGSAHGLEGWSERSAGERAEVVESGLVLDLLAHHTTPLLTAEQRTQSELRERYRHRAGILADLVQALKGLFLLTDPAGDSAQAAGGTRLGHDTLAPLVRQRYDISVSPGQRARRILESRGSEWRGGRTAAPLDAWDLKVVEAGLPGMRALQPDEERLLAASRQERRRHRRNLWLLRAAGLAVLAGVGVVLWQAWRVEERHRLIATPQEVQRLLAVEPVAGLTEAIAATGDSLDRFGHVFTPVQLSLLRAMEEARERQRFNHGSAVSCVAASPDGRTVASAGEDGAIRLWGLNGEAPRVLPKAGTIPRAIAFSRDGLLASVGDDGRLRLWSAADGTLRATSQEHHTGVAWTVAFSPDGKLAATGGDDRLIRLWDSQGRLVAPPFQGHDGPVNELVFSPDGSTIASASQDGTVRLWDLQGRPVAEPYRGHGGPVYAVTFSPDGKSLASGGEDGSLRQWTPDGRNAYPPLRRHEGAVNAVVFLDDNSLVSASEDQTVLFHDREGHRVIPPFAGFHGTVSTMAAIPGRLELVAGSDDKSVRILDFEHSQLGPALVGETGGGGIRRLAFASGGRLLALGSALWMFDTRKSDHPKLLTLADVTPNAVSALALSPGGKRLAAGSADGSIQLWDAGGRRLGPPFADGDQKILALRFSKQGDRLLSGDANATVVVREADGKVLHKFSGNRKLSAVAFRADGEHVAAGTDDGSVLLWNAEGKTLHSPLRPATVRIVSLAWNPSAPYLASGDDDGYLSIWDVNSGHRVCQEKAHNFEVSSLDWSPEGDSLISSGNDRSVRLWDLQCKKLGELNGHWKSVAAVAFSEVGEIAASAGRDGTVRLWRADWHDWLRLSCERLRQHPVFTHPPDARSRRAREVCQSLGRLKKAR